jgi:hypothetical protein
VVGTQQGDVTFNAKYDSDDNGTHDEQVVNGAGTRVTFGGGGSPS